MATFIMLTRLIQSQKGPPLSTEAFQKQLVERIGQACPDIEWRGSFAVLGPYDFLDIFSAPDIDAAMLVAATVRGTGHAHTEIWGRPNCIATRTTSERFTRWRDEES